MSPSRKILLVDLGTGAIGEESFDPGAILGLGGKALGIGLLEKYLDPHADPLGPGNVLVMAPSPLAGHMFPGSNRLGAYSKSPLTDAWLECYVGGSISRTLRETGWEALVITGVSSAPCHLHVDAKGAALLPADGLWGRDSFETEAAILPSLDRRSSVLCIGPAGEKLVAFASVMHEQAHALGRGGMGAVFGSKRLKALSVTSPGPTRLEASEAFASTRLAVTKLASESPVSDNYRRFGTPMMVSIMNEAGAFPTGFWESGRAAHRSGLEAEGWQEWAKVDTDTCVPCPMRCRKRLTLLEGEDAGRELHGPEYETLYAFGGSCMVSHARDVARLNEVCNRLGMDTISSGNVLALAMKGRGLGRLDGAIGGVPEPGDVEAIGAGLEAIAHRSSALGDLLAGGMDAAAEALGLTDLAITSKGLDPAGYESRKMPGMALSYALNPRGACHLRTTLYKAELAGYLRDKDAAAYMDVFIDWEDRLLLADSLIVCRFYRDFLTWEKLLPAVGQLAGREVGKAELTALSTAVLTRIRRLNFAMGLSPADDTIPERFFTEATDSAPALDRADFAAKIGIYWERRGWGGEGRP